MSKIIMTFAAREDLKEIKEYISVTLRNPSAASGILKGITGQLRMLEQFPEMGNVLLSDEGPITYRYLTQGNYMSFYHIHNNAVIVDRILYARRNYMQLLFGSSWEEDGEVQ